METQKNREEIAIVGMAGRFPGAKNVVEFWHNLRGGVDAIRRFSVDELEAVGISADKQHAQDFVNAGALLDDADKFDADFFGITPHDATYMDPQHRLFLDCAWSAIEDAGYNVDDIDFPVGVYGGVSSNTYYLHNVVNRSEIIENLMQNATLIGREHAITRVAYQLNLKGPALSINTDSSTSGVAIHLAVQSLLSGETDMALAGGARIHVPLTGGYTYVENGGLSPDGHCRVFDAKAQGTVIGSGGAVIVLKRLSDAIADGDTVYALVKGTAVNNDGARKADFSASSVDGQSAVITKALAIAQADASSISYIEAHGAGTVVDDRNEITGLTNAFREQTNANSFCALGSVKSNVGHLDTAACVTGVIKTVLSMRHEMLPATLNVDAPTPQINFDKSPFYINRTTTPWLRTDKPRRAGVSAFGLGGTNVHIILEEAPIIERKQRAPKQYVLPLSARTEDALDSATHNLANHLQNSPELELADVAFTLQTGRCPMPYRRAVLATDLAEAIEQLAGNGEGVLDGQVTADKTITFMFPGGGAQYVGMAGGLYGTNPAFMDAVDDCAAILHPLINVDIRDVILGDEGDMNLSSFALPALFTIEYAFAKLWLSMEITPDAMIGHSMGEYTAAHLAGVFSLEDALALIVKRGELFDTLSSGSMLSVALSESELARYIEDTGLSIASTNKPNNCVVSGESRAIVALEKSFIARNIQSKRLRINVAAHSALVEPILEPFREFVSTIKLAAPKIPFISNVSGTWITRAKATSPDYWVRHLRQTVRFAEGIAELAIEPNRIFLEVGPGQGLNRLVRDHAQTGESHVVLASSRHPKEKTADTTHLLQTIRNLWLTGTAINWHAFHTSPQRIPLPTYPFERKRFWIDSPSSGLMNDATQSHNVANTIRLKGMLDASILRDEVEQLMARHKSLCTMSPATELVQPTALAATVEWRMVDMTGLSSYADSLTKVQSESANAPFDLVNGPLCRSALIQLAIDEHVLILTTHRSVFEDWSTDKWIHELNLIYQGEDVTLSTVAFGQGINNSVNAVVQTPINQPSSARKTASVPSITLPRLIDMQTEQAPGAVALVVAGERLTYRELSDRANRLANYLLSEKIGVGDSVGVCMYRTADLLVALLAVLKAGAICVPFDPTHPVERLATMLKNSDTKLLLTHGALKAVMPSGSIQTIAVDEERENIAAHAKKPPKSDAVAQSPAYIIYGSSLRAIQVTHHALVNQCYAIADKFDLSSQDRVLQFSSISLSISIEEVLATLATGATLVMRPESQFSSVDLFADFVVQEHVSVASLPVRFWYEWSDKIVDDGLAIPEQLRLVIADNEAVSLDEFRGID